MIKLEHVSLKVVAPPPKKTNVSAKILSALNIGTKKTLLEDINFTINSGDRIALVGKNGAGKSTLCKVLSGAIKPTSGKIIYDGKIPTVRLLSMSNYLIGKMTGLENIYYMGAMMGITKSEISEKEKEIIQFSELKTSINEQYATYSSGMKSRLRFSIVTAFPADIIILDEILSVGDKDFKLKAKQRMNSLITKAECLIMVNHNHKELQNFCNKEILIENGSLVHNTNIN